MDSTQAPSGLVPNPCSYLQAVVCIRAETLLAVVDLQLDQGQAWLAGAGPGQHQLLAEVGKGQGRHIATGLAHLKAPGGAPGARRQRLALTCGVVKDERISGFGSGVSQESGCRTLGEI